MITKLYYCRSCGNVSIEQLTQSDIDNEFYLPFSCDNLRMEDSLTKCGGIRIELDIKKLIGDIFK